MASSHASFAFGMMASCRGGKDLIIQPLIQNLLQLSIQIRTERTSDRESYLPVEHADVGLHEVDGLDRAVAAGRGRLEREGC